MNDQTKTKPEVEVIFAPETIAARLGELAAEIAGAKLENLLVVAILKGSFEDGAIGALGLAAAATPPTLVAVAAFQLLPG